MLDPVNPRTAMNASGRANRVAPDGSTHAVADRGLFWGNRGQLLNAEGKPVRHSRGRNWLICQLEFKGRRRTQWRPDRLTELYFLDEPTALAAGHRPCGECRYHDYQRFKAAWTRAHPDAPDRAADIDRRLHVDRLGPDGPRTHVAPLASLPDGTIVEHEDTFWLVRGAFLHAWTFGGYTAVRSRPDFPADITVRTPRATVATLRAGYEPTYHPTATVPAA
jgi:hypothetical protein